MKHGWADQPDSGKQILELEDGEARNTKLRKISGDNQKT